MHYSLEGAQKRGGEGGSDLPSVSSVEFLCVSKNTSHICRKLSDLLQIAFFDYFFSENSGCQLYQKNFKNFKVTNLRLKTIPGNHCPFIQGGNVIKKNLGAYCFKNVLLLKS